MQLKQICDTFANNVEFDNFERMYKTAVDKPHGFLFIDTVPKKNTRDFVVDSISTCRNGIQCSF